MPAKKKNGTQEASEQTEKTASGKENDGEEISLEEAFNMLDEITRSLEKEDISLEDSFSAYKKGMDITIIQKLLNHSSPSVTLSYIGITRDDLDNVYLNLNL